MPDTGTVGSSDEGLVAVKGHDGVRAEDLIAAAMRDGTEFMSGLVGRALSRFNSNGEAVRAADLFKPEDIEDLADSLAETLAMGDLLGRSRVHEQMHKLDRKPATFAEKPDKKEPFEFVGEIQPLPPDAALTYFKSLVPKLGVDPSTFAVGVRRASFTLAESTSKAITKNVQQAIFETLKNGDGNRAGAIKVEEILNAAGITPANPQYCEMVYRTNAMSSYNQGYIDEANSSPVVAEFFPVWEYMGIDDGRERDRHKKWFGKFFPTSVKFEEVRDHIAGKFDGYNCRCVPRLVSKYEWAKLQAHGARLQTLP